jgi:hypothetical protein
MCARVYGTGTYLCQEGGPEHAGLQEEKAVFLLPELPAQELLRVGDAQTRHPVKLNTTRGFDKNNQNKTDTCTYPLLTVGN